MFIMANQIERKPIRNWTTGELNKPGEMLKFLMDQANISRQQLYEKLNDKHPYKNAHFIANPSLISDFRSDKKDDHGNDVGRTIPRHYLVQLIECLGMKKKEERYYIREFLRSGLPVELEDYVNAPKMISSRIAQGMALKNMRIANEELLTKHNKLSVELLDRDYGIKQLNSELESWLHQAFLFATELDVMDPAGNGPQGFEGESRVKVLEKKHNDMMLDFMPDPVDYEEEILVQNAHDNVKAKKLFVTVGDEIVSQTSSKYTKNMINSFFRGSSQSDGFIHDLYLFLINNNGRFDNHSKLTKYEKNKDFLRRPSEILSSLYNDWRTQPLAENEHDLTIESKVFEEYCCDLFLDYRKCFPTLSSSFISPFDATDPKVMFHQLKKDYLSQKTQYDQLHGANLQSFEEHTAHYNQPYKYFDMPVCTALSFASFASAAMTVTNCHQTIYNNKNFEIELDYLPSNISLSWLFATREHEHSAPDAGIYLSELMDGEFELKQAQKQSVAILKELSKLREKDSFLISLGDTVKKFRERQAQNHLI